MVRMFCTMRAPQTHLHTTNAALVIFCDCRRHALSTRLSSTARSPTTKRPAFLPTNRKRWQFVQPRRRRSGTPYPFRLSVGSTPTTHTNRSHRLYRLTSRPKRPIRMTRMRTAFGRSSTRHGSKSVMSIDTVQRSSQSLISSATRLGLKETAPQWLYRRRPDRWSQRDDEFSAHGYMPTTSCCCFSVG